MQLPVFICVHEFLPVVGRIEFTLIASIIVRNCKSNGRYSSTHENCTSDTEFVIREQSPFVWERIVYFEQNWEKKSEWGSLSFNLYGPWTMNHRLGLHAFQICSHFQKITCKTKNIHEDWNVIAPLICKLSNNITSFTFALTVWSVYGGNRFFVLLLATHSHVSSWIFHHNYVYLRNF